MIRYTIREKRKGPGCWLPATVLVLVLVAATMSLNLGDLRSRFVSSLGDDIRNEITALYSSLTMRHVETADMVPIRYTGMNPMGVNTFLEQEVEIAKRRQTLQMIKDAGIGFIRQQFPWEDIERPTKGRFWDEKYLKSSWEKYDNIVDLANEYGIQMIVRLDLPPKWAHPNNEWPHTPPENLSDYGDFVYSVVSRYKGKVKYYQLWNEPNLAIEWGGKEVNANDYVQLLKIGYQRAKEADPDAVIISAALAPTIEESWQALNDQIYLQEMYDAGAKDYFDILSVMAYGLRFGPDDRRLALKDVNFSRPLLIREIMVKNGDASKPIWASEMGWNAQPDSTTAEPVFGRVSEALQARYTVRGFQRAAQEWPWMGVMNIWFFKRADDHEVDQPMYYFRLVNPDFTPQPVYEAVKALGAEPAILHRGFVQEDHRALVFQGEWKMVSDPQASLGSMKSTAQAGATISAQFEGTSISLVVPEGPEWGQAYVEIDGSPQRANLLPKDGSARATVDLASPEKRWQQQIPVASDLSGGTHQLVIKTGGPFALDGIVVDSPPPWWAQWLVPAIGGAAAVLLVFLLALVRSQIANRGRLRL
ncbi:MAG TPA: cellulase family glycosylhydrolase [Chloroflexota bacterium]|nr:cellulase family glycosylhydrolase [Chloroflexota bacterium]